jgi:hypothetical protein
MSGAEHSGRPTQMAIAKNRPVKGASGKRPFPWVSGFVLLVVIGTAIWWFYGAAIRGYALAGTGYGAKNACSCRYISGRDLNSCEADFVPGMEMVMLSEDAGAKSVTASVPLIASQTARYRDGYGCVLDSLGG